MGVGVYGEWSWGSMERERGGVWRVGDVVCDGEGERGCIEWARGCMESGRGGVWRVGLGVYGEWSRGGVWRVGERGVWRVGVGVSGEWVTVVYGEWA